MHLAFYFCRLSIFLQADCFCFSGKDISLPARSPNQQSAFLFLLECFCFCGEAESGM
jgi:hypothetical protein